MQSSTMLFIAIKYIKSGLKCPQCWSRYNGDIKKNKYANNEISRIHNIENENSTIENDKNYFLVIPETI